MDILKFSRCFVLFRELALILFFKSKYLQISLTFYVVYVTSLRLILYLAVTIL